MNLPLVLRPTTLSPARAAAAEFEEVRAAAPSKSPLIIGCDKAIARALAAFANTQDRLSIAERQVKLLNVALEEARSSAGQAEGEATGVAEERAEGRILTAQTAADLRVSVAERAEAAMRRQLEGATARVVALVKELEPLHQEIAHLKALRAQERYKPRPLANELSASHAMIRELQGKIKELDRTIKHLQEKLQASKRTRGSEEDLFMEIEECDFDQKKALTQELAETEIALENALDANAQLYAEIETALGGIDERSRRSDEQARGLEAVRKQGEAHAGEVLRLRKELEVERGERRAAEACALSEHLARAGDRITAAEEARFDVTRQMALEGTAARELIEMALASGIPLPQDGSDPATLMEAMCTFAMEALRHVAEASGAGAPA